MMPPTSIGTFGIGVGTATPNEPQIRIAALWSMMPNPIVPMSMRLRSLLSRGRRMRSIPSPITAVRRTAAVMATAKGRCMVTKSVAARNAPIMTTSA